MKTEWFGMVAAIMIGAGLVLLWQYRRLASSRAEVASIEVVRDSILDLLSEGEQQVAQLEASVRAARARADTAALEAQVEIDSAHRQAQDAEAALRQALIQNPGATADLDALLAAHRTEVDALTRRIYTLTSLIEEQDLLVARQRVQIDRWAAAHEAEAALARHWQREYEATQVLWRSPEFIGPVSAILAAGLTYAVVK